MANRRKNQETKAASTAERPDRNSHVDGGEAIMVAPVPPSHLTPEEKAEWKALANDLVKSKILTSSDLRGLETVCVVLALERQFRAKVAEGLVLIVATTKGPRIITNPAVKSLFTVQQQVMRMLSEFGLTPRGRQSIDKIKTPSAKNPFEGI